MLAQESSAISLEILLRWLPYGVGALASIAAVLAGLHLLVTALARRRGPAPGRWQRLALAAVAMLAPVATLGFSRAGWHRVPMVRVAEIGFGIVLVTVIALGTRALVVGRRGVPVSRVAGEFGPGPGGRMAGAFRQGGPVHVSLLVLLVGWAGVAFVLHGAGLLEVGMW